MSTSKEEDVPVALDMELRADEMIGGDLDSIPLTVMHFPWQDPSPAIREGRHERWRPSGRAIAAKGEDPVLAGHEEA